MLNPNSQRSLYTSIFSTPPGMVFDEAIGATFSMDPEILLELPVYLTMKMARDDAKRDPLTMLESLRKYTDKITVFVQKGRIQVSRITQPNPLYALLEGMIVEVKAPRGGVFHPKLWVMKFVNENKSNSLIRLVVLTKNMTADNSWDLSLQLEGEVGDREVSQNKPLVHFFESLPELAQNTIWDARRVQVGRFAEVLQRVQWEVPDGFMGFYFYLHGINNEPVWSPPPAKQTVIMSPFCSDEAIRHLVRFSDSSVVLISRPESLALLKPETRALFSKCLQLAEAAEVDDGEESDASEHPFSVGLHAKLFLFEVQYHSRYLYCVLGSANATDAALLDPKNIEFLVELIGKKTDIGGIDKFLDDDGLGEYLIPFEANKEILIDTDREEAEKYIEKAIRLLSETKLSVVCRPCVHQENLWTLTLIGQIPRLEGIKSAYAWPITLSRDFAVNILENDEVGIELGAFSITSLTGLIAFKLLSNHPEISAQFVFNLPLEGIPEERNAALIKTVIRNREDFIRYLMLLLGDEAAPYYSNNGDISEKSSWMYKIIAGEETPLIEELTRAYSRNPERLHEISKLIHELQSHDERESVIPESFLVVWKVFESALGVSHVS